MNWLQPKYIIPISIIIGLLATFATYRFIENKIEAVNEEKNATEPVVVAATDLSIGTLLTSDLMMIKEWPQDIVPKNVVSDASLIQSRVIKVDIMAGEAILFTKLAPEGSAAGFSSLIPAGMRAMTVSVNIVSGVSGFILPNTRVDVLVTVNPATRKEEATTKIILEDILVLAVDQTFVTKDDDPQTVQSVTLLVTPEQAEKLALGSTEGTLQLTLRNNIDQESKPTSGVKLKELVTNPRPVVRRRTTPVRRTPPPAKEEPEKVAPPPPRVVEVIRSNERSEVTFKQEENAQDKSQQN